MYLISNALSAIQLQTVITSMSEYLERPSPTPNNPSMLHMLQRHKDIAFDYSKELRKVKVRLISSTQGFSRVRGMHRNNEPIYRQA